MAEYNRAGGFICRYSWTLFGTVATTAGYLVVFGRSRISVSSHTPVILGYIVVPFSHPQQILAQYLIFNPYIFRLRLTNQLRNAGCILNR